MANKLTKKQKTFVDAYLVTGNGTQSALKAYDTDSPQVAEAIGSENLSKPIIQKALAEALNDELLVDTHVEMLSQVRLDYFVFSKNMSDEEIVSHVDSVGLKCVNIRPSDKGKLAFFAIPDSHARGKALELAYKIKGSFAPEKRVTLLVDVETTQVIKELTDKLNGIYRGTSGGGDGGPTSSVGTEA